MNGRWTNGEPVVNIVDMFFTNEGTFGPRDDQIGIVGQDVVNAWQDHIVANLCNNYTFEGATFVDMDSANGLVGSQAANGAKPTAGTSSGEALPPSQTLLVRKYTGGRRGERAGRMFLAGMGESDLDENGIWTPGFLTGWREALDDFLESLSDFENSIDVPKYPVVVHSKSATATRITSLDPQPKVAYQGRRIGR